MPESSSEYISAFVQTLLSGASAEELRDAQDNLDRVLDLLDEICDERAQQRAAARQDDRLEHDGTVKEASQP